MTISTIDNETYTVPRNWRSPVSFYPERAIGHAAIKKIQYVKGLYRYEGVDGFQYYRVRGRGIAVTALEIKGEVWMVDDPLHDRAMSLYVQQAAPGHLLCAGLGLGLCVWYACQRADITRITVVERTADVIELIGSLLPNDPRIELIHSDFYVYRPDFTPDTLLWDLAVGDPPETQAEFAKGSMICKYLYPDVQRMYFGFRNLNGGVVF